MMQIEIVYCIVIKNKTLLRPLQNFYIEECKQLLLTYKRNTEDAIIRFYTACSYRQS